MDVLIVILAGIGASLGWQRAKPLEPLRKRLIIWLNRSEMALRRWRWTRWSRWTGVPYVLWWARGLFGCGECLTPYTTLSIALTMGHGWMCIPLALAGYAIYVVLVLPVLDQED